VEAAMKILTLAILIAALSGCSEKPLTARDRECNLLLTRTLDPGYQASAAEEIAANECLGISREDQRRLNADREAELLDELRAHQDELRRLRMRKQKLE
jgi:hypothetical protein